MDSDTEIELRRVAEERLGARVGGLTPLGGGFYGRVYLASIDIAPYRVVLKAYLFTDIARREAMQLNALRRYSPLAMPEVYFVADASDGVRHETLCMEYLEGINAGIQKSVAEPARSAIARDIVAALKAFHNVENPAGFGALDAAFFGKDFRDAYRPTAERAFRNAVKLRDSGEMPPDTLRLIERAMTRFDKIFYLPITSARLIHGDYNTWNVLLDARAERAVALIDPFNCGWADPEFDLYQLENANGRMYGLLPLYESLTPLTENFPLKRLFYEVFTEINHYSDARVPLGSSSVPERAEALTALMAEWGIV